jgi:hypothetical protein
MKQVFVTAFRSAFTACILLSLSCLAYAQHGGGGGHSGGGHGGHFGGGGRMHSGHLAHGQKSRGIMRYPPFSAARIFGRHRHRNLAGQYFFANGLLLGDYVNCGLWDWNCIGWEDGYFDSSGTYATPGTGESASNAGNRSPTVTVLYLKNGYSVGVTDYYLENERLHYLTTYGGEDEVPIDSVDLQRTVNENASMGVPFVLHPKQVAPAPENH